MSRRPSPTAESGGGGTCPMKMPDVSDSTRLMKVMECPVCHEVAKPPIFTCTGNSHMICSDCRKKYDLCPICRTPVSKNRCLFAEQYMEQVALPCKFRDEGCHESIRVIDYHDHLAVCRYRYIPCFMRKCEVKVPYTKFFQHMIAEHGNAVNGIENKNKHTVEWWIDGTVQPARWPPYYFTCFNNVFLYMAISTIHGMWEWAWILANEEEAHRFRVSAKIHSVDNLSDIQWTGIVHSIRKSVPEIIESGICFVTNSKDIRNPYLFRKVTDVDAEVESRYYWRTDVEFLQVAPRTKASTPYILTSDTKKDHVTPVSTLPDGISAIASTVSLQGGPALTEANAMVHMIQPSTDADTPMVGSRSASEELLKIQRTVPDPATVRSSQSIPVVAKESTVNILNKPESSIRTSKSEPQMRKKSQTQISTVSSSVNVPPQMEITLLRETKSEKVNPKQSENQVVPRRSENQVIPKRSENQVIPKRSENQVVPKQSKNQVNPKRSENQVIPERSENQVIPKRSEGQVIAKKSENLVIPKLSENQVIAKKSENQVISKRSEDQLIPKRSENQVFSTLSENQVISMSSEQELQTNSQQTLNPVRLGTNKKTEDTSS